MDMRSCNQLHDIHCITHLLLELEKIKEAVFFKTASFCIAEF